MKGTRVQGSLPTHELLVAAKSGDRAAFDVVVQRFEGRLRESVGSRIGAHLQSKIDVDDVVQETFAKAYKSLARFEWRGEEAFLSWLRTISENFVLHVADRYRSEKLFELDRQLHPGAGEEATASRAARRGERFERLREALASLSADHREVILLARIEGLQLKEIAARMNRSVSAVQNLLLRALKELKRSFGDTESFHLPDRHLGPGGPDGTK